MSRPLPELTLFLDENFGTTTVADALRKAGIKVEVLADHFERGTRDETWLPEVGRRGWAVVTKDKRIRHRQVEMDALMGAGVVLGSLILGLVIPLIPWRRKRRWDQF